jgi:hypothetical protein
MEPIVSDEPSYEENELGNTEVFSACVLSRAMSKKLEKEEIL